MISCPKTRQQMHSVTQTTHQGLGIEEMQLKHYDYPVNISYNLVLKLLKTLSMDFPEEWYSLRLGNKKLRVITYH